MMLLDYLVDKYVAEMKRRNCDADPGSQIDVEHEREKLNHFVTFASEFMSDNRPSAIRTESGNYEVSLTNGDQVLISPSDGEQLEPGSLQPSTYVPVTGHNLSPKGQNMRRPEGSRDYTVPSPPQRVR